MLPVKLLSGECHKTPLTLIQVMAWCHQKRYSSLVDVYREFYLPLLKLEYSEITRSIPWLQMHWLLASPGHQQLRHWLSRINNSRGRISITCISSVSHNYWKCKHIFIKKNLHIRSKLIFPSDAYMRQWIGSALVQIMACSLFSAKPISKLMQGYCQLDP